MPDVTPEGYEGPYRFQFWSSDGPEPPHIHVRRDRKDAKIWLDPVEVARNHGYRDHELKKVVRLVEEHSETLMHAWHGFFGD